MTDIRERMAKLSPEKRTLLLQQVKDKGLDVQKILAAKEEPEPVVEQEIQFSLFFFSGDGSKTTNDKYELVLSCAQFADEHGFTAIWTPERHFQDFGGLYPNPSVLSGAIAVLTKEVRIRAGSVVMPLHHPVRVAEEWAIVDNLSNGRVDLSFATGWHPADFVMAPHKYSDRRHITFADIEQVRRLWQGEGVSFIDGQQQKVDIQILPRPIQPQLPIWLTVSSNPETVKKAGEMGANILTMLGLSSLDKLKKTIDLYRQTLAESGHDPASGTVTVMLHTFIGLELDMVREKVKAPLQHYLQTFIAQVEEKEETLTPESESEQETHRQQLMATIFNNYFETNSLLGTPNKCHKLINQLKRVGVDEIACLVDFGLPTEEVLSSLHHLNGLKNKHSKPAQDIELKES